MLEPFVHGFISDGDVLISLIKQQDELARVRRVTSHLATLFVGVRLWNDCVDCLKLLSCAIDRTGNWYWHVHLRVGNVHLGLKYPVLICIRSPTPLPQYLLSVTPNGPSMGQKERRQAAPSYVTANGEVTGDCAEADTFTLTANGQLLSGGEYVSTTGLVAYEPLAPSSDVAAISTPFSTVNNSLAWNNPAFINGSALFCLMGSTVESVFDGQLPSGCAEVTLYLVNAGSGACARPMISPSGADSSVTGSVVGTPTTASASPASSPGIVHGSTASADPVGGYLSTPSEPVLSGAREITSSLESCADFCVGYTYFGVSDGTLFRPGSDRRTYRDFR